MRIVLALGGNALLERGEALTAENQLNNIKKAAASIAKIAKNNELVIVHGNGPQVGLLMEQNAAYNEVSPETTPYPMDVLGAQTCGMVGYMLQKELLNVDSCLGVVSLLTQTVVNKEDEAFNNPTKFVGPVYSKERAEEIMADTGVMFKADGEYYRRVVASPTPHNIIELYQIEALLKQKSIVIAGGGGGVPVAYDSKGIELTGVECVIDKDSTACLMSKLLDADMFIILTDGAVYEDFGKPSQRAIQKISSTELKTYDFPAGSMGPKVDAVCDFVDKTSRSAAIGSLFELDEILRGEAGTHITDRAELTYYL
ncbi:carbamate kinase [Vibrio sp. MACH09]|uniref:carbamate kinase n=1 Tax=Vibrio sp. MACH09 TaxID=3025122 RepID=UPI00279209B1|nr:carbamate kinase [Vibrio sp. MACH09]GLO62799.1 carbamate kinase [Vibrio sp. MACH09]